MHNKTVGMDTARLLFNHCEHISHSNAKFAKNVDNYMSETSSKLDKVNAIATGIESTVLPQSLQLTRDYLTQIQARVVVCVQMSERVLETEESKQNEELKQSLLKNRREIQIKMEEMKKMAEKEREQILQEFENEKCLLENEYEEKISSFLNT